MEAYKNKTLLEAARLQEHGDRRANDQSPSKPTTPDSEKDRS